MLSLLLALTAQSHPQQSQFIEESLRVGRLGVAAAVCEQVGVIRETNLSFPDEFSLVERRAISAGVDVNVINSAIKQSATLEATKAMQLLTGLQNNTLSQSDLINYLETRCTSITTYYPQYFVKNNND